MLHSDTSEDGKSCRRFGVGLEASGKILEGKTAAKARPCNRRRWSPSSSVSDFVVNEGDSGTPTGGQQGNRRRADRRESEETQEYVLYVGKDAEREG